MRKTKKQSVVGTSRRLVRSAVSSLPAAAGQQSVVGTSRRLVRPSNIIPTGPRTRDQHLNALSARIHATHKALIVVATGIVNLKRKLHRQEEIYRCLAHNYGARTAEHTRQIVEASAIN